MNFIPVDRSQFRHSGRPNEALAYFARHVMEPSEGCRPWPLQTDQDGYGRFVVGGKELRVNVLTCEVWQGAPSADQRVAAHSCGNPNCWAGEHLRWATYRENVLDKNRDGTMPRGEHHHKSKLTADQVREIRAQAPTIPLSELARRHGVSPQSIGAIVKRKTWTHI